MALVIWHPPGYPGSRGLDFFTVTLVPLLLIKIILDESVKKINKKSIRKLARSKRNSIHRLKGLECSKDISNIISDWLVTKRKDLIVAGYVSVNSELDLSITFNSLCRLQTKICLPVVKNLDQPLKFKYWDTESTLIEGKFGILVPAFGKIVRPDILLCPLLSYDSKGYRLGYGGGFYDRTIEHLKNSGEIMSLGCCYSEQLFEGDLPREEHDMPLDGIVTEKGIRFF